MVGVDFDGTVINFGRERGRKPIFNDRLLASIQGKGDPELWIVTNQGGLPFGLRHQHEIDTNGFVVGQTKPRKHPTPDEFVSDVIVFSRYLKRFNLDLKGVSVAIYHKSADKIWIAKAAQQVKRKLTEANIVVIVFEDPKYRKPSGEMLKGIVTLQTYYGDDLTDQEAANEAGKAFILVARFEEEQGAYDHNQVESF